MMTSKQNISAASAARFSPGNVRGAIPAGTDRAMPSSGVAHPAATVSKGPTMLSYVTTADRAYIAHDLPKPVVRDVFGPTLDPEPAGIDWEGIAIGAFLVGFLVLASIVLFKVADFDAASANLSAWRVLRAQ